MYIPYKSFPLLLACPFTLLGVLDAQAQKPDKPEFDKRVFRADNGKLYINKALPVYLNLSTDKNGGKNHLLKSKRTGEYANPLYFDTEGINFIRHRWAVNEESKKTVRPKVTVKFEVYADSRTPRTSPDFTGAESYVSPTGNVYYGEGLDIALAANDAVAGVDEVRYALDATSYNTYSNPIDVSDEGKHKLFYFAHDRVGNAEDAHKRKFTVDLSPPKTTKTIKGQKHNETIIGPESRYVFERNDNLSGVKYTYYKINNGSFKVYDPGKPVYVSYLDDGTHAITFYSDDRVENEEDKETFEFYLDKVPPEVSLTLKGDKYEGGRIPCVSPRTKVKMSAKDNKAGVKEIRYNVDGSGNETYKDPYQLQDETGKQRIVYFARDNVENKSTAGAKTVYMDNRTPNTAITYGNPKFFNRDTLFINEETNIRLRANDRECGVKKTLYKVDGGTEKTYTSPFNLQQEGYREVAFRSVDNVNNEEEAKKSQVYVDNTPPKIYHNFSIDPIGTKTKNGKKLKVYPNYTRLFLGSTDNKAGSEEILYSMDGGPMKAYSSPETLDISELTRFEEEKYYKVKVKAIDKLGNTREETIEFFVGYGDD